jgi:hypothetical protein
MSEKARLRATFYIWLDSRLRGNDGGGLNYNSKTSHGFQIPFAAPSM